MKLRNNHILNLFNQNINTWIFGHWLLLSQKTEKIQSKKTENVTKNNNNVHTLLELCSRTIPHRKT